MRGKKNEGHILHQPPGAAELQRYPPRSSVCAQFRGMLRDYADEDLAPRDRAAVDDHLHSCRDCSLALARAEHEVLRIRAAMTGRQPGQQSGPVGPARAPAGFTAAVLTRLHQEPVARRSRRLRWWALVPAAAAVVVGARLATDAWGAEAPGPRVTIRAASDAVWVQDGGAQPVRDGETRRLGGLLQVGTAGHAEIILPPSELRLEGDSRLQVGETATLYHGALAVRSGERQEIEVPGAGTIRLGMGRYHVSAVPIHRFDAALTSEELTRVRLEVLGGQPAEVLRMDGVMHQVRDGEVAQFDSLSQMRIGPALSEQRLISLLGQRADPAQLAGPGTAELSLGRVTDANGVGVAGATVDVQVRSSGGPETVKTDSDGRFQITALEQLRGEDIILQVRPPEATAGQVLAVYGPVPRRLRETPDSEGFLLGTVQLEPERVVMGRIRDEEDFRSVSGARVVPLLMDELLGVVQPLWSLATESNADGEFALHYLPATLQPHTALVLLTEAPGYAPELSHALAGTAPSQSDRLIELQLSRGVRSEIPHAAGQSLEVGLSLPGLPGDSPLWIRMDADVNGRATVHAGKGVGLWLRSLSGVGTDLQALETGPDGLSVPSDPPRFRAASMRSALRGGRLRLAGDQRYRQLARAAAGRPVVFSVIDAQSNAARGDTYLLLLSEGGSAYYLGEYDALTGLSTTLPAVAVRILAVGADGSTGLLEVAADSPERVQVQTQDIGHTVLAAGSQPDLQGPEFLDLELRAVDGPLPGRAFTRRVRRDQDWQMSGLVPGRYQVTASDGRTGRLRIEPGRTMALQLR